jgi:hypothetical protein
MSLFGDLELAEPMCQGGIMLEPRLQEYLKKRKINKKYNINPSIPLEDEYMITSDDLKRLRSFLNGDKGIYLHNRQDEFIDSNECQGYNDKNKYNFFPSREFKNDPHFKLLQKKMQRDKDAQQQRNNYDDYMFMKPTDLVNKYHNSQKYENSLIMDDERETGDAFDIPTFVDSKFYNDGDNKYKANNFKSSDVRKYNNVPNIQYKQRVPTLRDNKIDENNCLPHDNNLNGIIGSLDSYSDHVNTNYQRKNEMDFDNKIVVPSLHSKDKKYINTAGYQSIPMMKKDGLKDVGRESIMRGLPSRDTKKKSYGYSNPAEHYFDYITDDIQSPEHVVMPFPRGGDATRQDNKSTARPYKYKREILN